MIDVGAFLAIDLDAHERIVEDFGDGFVVEGFTFHDVAPVTRAVADGQKDEFAFLLGFFKSLRTPRIPVGWIVGVHEEIGAGLLGEAIGKFGFIRGRLAAGSER
jgi:hypothetical protein